jgi:predicted Zn-dependent protease
MQHYERSTNANCLTLVPCYVLQCRAAEYEADAIGIRLLVKACYDPDAKNLHLTNRICACLANFTNLTICLLTCRAAEYEADAIGIRLLAKACYDPDANVTMLQKLNAVQGGTAEARMPEFLSTHPLTTVRT